jgi:ankyrin repeat protein
MVAAILKNDANRIAALIAQGAPVNASDSKGNSLLVIAATDPREHRALTALLEAKADPNYASANGKLPVHAVLRMKDGRMILQSITALLEAGADPNKIEQRPDRPHMTAFQIAYEENRDDKIYDKLLSSGADPSLGEDVAKGVFSPLHGLAAIGRYAVLETAHNCGINIDRQAANGMTCLMLAARAGAAKTIETLLECNADPTLKDNKGMDAMMYVRSAPPDTDYRPLLKLMSRAAKDHLLRKEMAALRAEVDSLRQLVAKSGTA